MELDVNKIKMDNLNRLLCEKKIRPIDLANMMGVTVSRISQLTSGASNIGEKTLLKLCDVLDVKRKEFFIHTDIDNALYRARHYDLVSRFENQKDAFEVSRLLLELENRDPDMYAGIKKILKALILDGSS